MISNLTRSEVRALSKACRAAGWKLPKVGWSVPVPPEASGALQKLHSEACGACKWPPVRVVADRTGYFYTFG